MARPSSRGSSRGSTRSTASAIPQLGWAAIRPAPVILVTGPEQFLAERAMRMLRDLLRAEDSSLEVHDVSAADYAPGELTTFASPSLFGEPRLIRVTDVEKSTDAFLEEAVAYLEAPADGAYLVLRHAGGVRGKKLLDAIRAGAGAGIEVNCAAITKDAERYDFAAAEFQVENRRITPGALRALVGAFADDLAELAAACRQLLSDETAEITEATVDRYYSGRVETNSFRVADLAIAGRLGDSLVMMRHALASGADPVPMVAAFAAKLRTMAKVNGARGGSGQLAARFGLAPWQVERAQRDLRGWDDEGLGRAIVHLAVTDAAVKGAERDPVYALERMIAVVCNQGRP